MDDLLDPLKYIEKFFKIVTKADELGRSELIPMVLWPAQKHYIENRTNRDVILKYRQLGMSTGIEAANTHKIFTRPYQRMSIITHDSETSEFLLQNVQRFYDNLPEDKKPTMAWKSANRKTFPGLDAYIYVESAKSDSIGIGHSLNIAHLSEVARYPDKRARDLFAGITQTIPMGGFISVESTPKGMGGLFYELYQSAKKGESPYKAFFYPWWWAAEYTIPDLEVGENEQADTVARILGLNVPDLISEEQTLMLEHNLSPGQIAWRREKISEIRDLFFQEYPEDDISCWLSSEMSVIEGSSLRPYFPRVKEGRHEGPVTVWKDKIGGRKYVMGVDSASGTSRDYSVASVIDCRTLEYVARIRGKLHTDLFAEEIYELGLRYNRALVGVERDKYGHAVLKTLLHKNYPNLFYHVDYDETIQDTISDVGWKTTSKTKPQMVAGMITAFRSQDLVSWSENLLDEIASLTWEGEIASKIKTPHGGNDDEFVAVSIALQIRDQEPISDDDIYSPAESYASAL